MDPLFQGLMYQYIKKYNEQHEAITFHVITEEHPEYKLSENEQIKKKEALKTAGVIWYPMQYRKGRFIILKKIYSIFLFLMQVRHIKREYGASKIIGSLVMASAYCWVAAKLFRLKLFTFCFEPHSLYMKEFGIWSKNSLKYRILSQMEKWTVHGSTHITAPTNHTVQLLKEWNYKGKVSRVPISVDTDKFSFTAKARKWYRQQYHIAEDRYAIMYLGKFGGIYYSPQEVAAFCKRLIDFDERIFIFTITPNDTKVVTAAFKEAGLGEEDFRVLGKIPYEEIENYISICDMGLVAIPPLDSQKYRTPVKIGNYLSCGLPFMVNRGIADDDVLAEEENVGVVFEDIKQPNIDKQLQSLQAFMQEDRQQLAERCRAVAIKHRGIHNSVEVLHEMITVD